MESKSGAQSMIKFDQKVPVYVAESKIEGAGLGLFAGKQISSSQPVVIYYGSKMLSEDVYDLFMSNPESYGEAQSIIRETPNGYAIRGEKTEKTALHGVYVNDVAKIQCEKDSVDRDALVEYINSAKNCNLKTIDTSDYPVYVSTRRIKKHEELYVHYGIGYWLLQMGYGPEELNVLDQYYKFSTLY